MPIALHIEQLLVYAQKHGLIQGLDVVLSRNLLLDLFRADAPLADAEKPETPTAFCRNLNLNISEILAPMLDYAYETGLIQENTVTQRDLFEGRIMVLLTPRQWEVEHRFHDLEKSQGIRAATAYFYDLSVATNYIKTDRIAKNIAWWHVTEFGALEVTVNLSKPEKEPRDIIRAASCVAQSYPLCLLCVENVGHAGGMLQPSRQNHRILPLILGGEPWYFQYSPYAYYPEHCIPLCGVHRAIVINDDTFVKLLDFLDRFPHYFVGSNADLPIVGGSILSHDHFQGGRHTFPIEKACALASFAFGEVQGEIVKWPMSVIRLKSKKRAAIIDTARLILAYWRAYADETAGVVPYTGDTPHNAVTPIARINAEGAYELDLVLRNNRTDDTYPDGIFHPHPHVHHIKKENIGLIEVMGLAILPGRLAAEMAAIEGYLLLKKDIADINKGHMLDKHKAWIASMLSEGAAADAAQAQARIKAGVGQKFLEVLTHAGVFKQDEPGLAAFERFITSCGGQCQKICSRFF